MTLDAAIVKRYEQSIRTSLQIMHPNDRAAEIVKLRQRIADQFGSDEWREALQQAIAKLEAR